MNHDTIVIEAVRQPPTPATALPAMWSGVWVGRIDIPMGQQYQKDEQEEQDERQP